ncbi:hypothetical protein ACVWWO_003603 [Bradyrhizobium sp. F1.13.1]
MGLSKHWVAKLMSGQIPKFGTRKTRQADSTALRNVGSFSDPVVHGGENLEKKFAPPLHLRCYRGQRDGMFWLLRVPSRVKTAAESCTIIPKRAKPQDASRPD